MQLLSRNAATRVFDLSDIHYAKETSDYGPKICEAWLHRWAERVCTYRERGTKLAVFLLGDTLDGSGIYPTQGHHQAESDVRAQASDCAKLLVDVTERLCQDWHSVEWFAVPGNHGRAGKYAHEAANWDLVAYQMMGLTLEAKRSPAKIHYYTEGPGEQVFFQRVKVEGHAHLLYHGQSIRAYQQLPIYGIRQRAMLWYIGPLGPFAALHLGHFHASALYRINKVEVFLTGSPAVGDPWALETLGLVGDSHGWTFLSTDREAVVSPTRVEVG